MPEMPEAEPRAYWVRLPDGTEYGPGSLTLMRQWTAEGRVPRSATLITRDGTPPVPVTQQPELLEVFEGKVTADSLPKAQGDDVLASLVPYRNMPALWGYYIGIFALIPGAGLLLGPTAMILGVIGVRLVKRRPGSKGAAHAWVAILLGALASLLNFGSILAFVVGKWNKWF
jgi:hypothetical protein